MLPLYFSSSSSTPPPLPLFPIIRLVRKSKLGYHITSVAFNLLALWSYPPSPLHDNAGTSTAHHLPQLTGLPFSKAMLPPSSSKRRRLDPKPYTLPALSTSAASGPASRGLGATSEGGTVGSRAEAEGAAGQLETRLVIDGLQGLQRLENISGALLVLCTHSMLVEQ